MFTALKAMISFLSVAISALPHIVELVKVAETLFPNSGQGSSKLALVLGTVQGAVAAAGAAQSEIDTIKPALTAAVNSVVEAYNQAGGVPKVDLSEAQVHRSATPLAPTPAVSSNSP